PGSGRAGLAGGGQESSGAAPMGFDIPRPALGAEAVRLLAARIAGGPAEGTLVACAFRPGATAGPPPAP
ncbi:LacI family transcriptional regulator, partial [Streptomyces tendae]